jgi:hypothetical protein
MHTACARSYAGGDHTLSIVRRGLGGAARRAKPFLKAVMKVVMKAVMKVVMKIIIKLVVKDDVMAVTVTRWL